MSNKTKYKLPKTAKTKWVKALRENSEKQISGYLCCDGRYCATGILAKAYGVSDEDLNRADDENIFYLPRMAKAKLPNAFRSCMNKDGDAKPICEPAANLVEKVVDWNDSGWSFNKIASHIERYY